MPSVEFSYNCITWKGCSRYWKCPI